MGILLIMLAIIASPEDRGVTTPSMRFEVYGDHTDEVTVGEVSAPARRQITTEIKGITWRLVDSVGFYGIIPARGGFVIEMMDSLLNLFPPNILEPEAIAAIESVPEWLKMPLEDNFSQMSAHLQRIYGGLITDSEARYRDEVAFCVANIDPGILAHHSADPQFFLRNAQRIYAHDALLQYVELVEYSDYTTARYRIVPYGTDTLEVKIPFERYYWDIVHPIISDEAPRYINPKTGLGAAPPVGRFWREYVFEHPDTAMRTVWCWGLTDTIHAGFVSPILRDELADVTILWGGETDIITTTAIGVVTQWMQDVMVFNSGFGFERPIQPTRIFHTHLGRCGEWADLTAAAGRAALIPTNSPLSICNDHIWNEWYDTEWRGWEPVNTFINSTHHYEAWGWNITLAFNFRGDGYIWDVTERYTPICTLTVTVNDIHGNPVDGARVLVASTFGKSVYVAGWHYTGTDGKAQFILGDNKPFFARIDSDIGSFPATPNHVVQVISHSVPGVHYRWSRNLTGSMPPLAISPDTLPEEPDSIYKIEVEFLVHEEIERGRTLFRNDLTMFQEFAKFVPGGDIDFFICDSLNYSIYDGFGGAQPFNAFSIGEDVGSGSVDFILPEGGKWYVVFSNEDALKIGDVISIKARLYIDALFAVAEERDPFAFKLYPNPSHSSITINLTLPESDYVSLDIYDLAGRHVGEIVRGRLSPGSHNIGLDGKNLPAGVYFVRLMTRGKELTEKAVIIR